MKIMMSESYFQVIFKRVIDRNCPRLYRVSKLKLGGQCLPSRFTPTPINPSLIVCVYLHIGTVRTSRSEPAVPAGSGSVSGRTGRFRGGTERGKGTELSVGNSAPRVGQEGILRVCVRVPPYTRAARRSVDAVAKVDAKAFPRQREIVRARPPPTPPPHSRGSILVRPSSVHTYAPHVRTG